MEHLSLSPGLEQVPELWFEDASLVVQAGHKCFRVHQGLLTARSRVFQDILALPPDADSKIHNDNLNCNYIKLPDPPDDVQFFLMAIYDSGFFEPPPTKTPLAAILSIARMSNKYDVQYLLRRAIRHLEIAFPLSLELWTSRRTNSTFRVRTTIEEDIDVILTSLEIGATWILPTAFYKLCLNPLDRILDSATWQNSIGNAQKRAILLGYTTQSNATRTLLSFLHLPLTYKCASHASCIEKGREWFNIQMNISYGDPLGAFDDNDWTALSTDICPPSLLNCKEEYAIKKESYWQGLPTIFCLPSWKELDKLKREYEARM